MMGAKSHNVANTTDHEKRAAGIYNTIREHRYTILVFISCSMELIAIMAMKSTISLFIAEMGGSTFLTGVLSTLIVVCAVIAKPIVGRLLDHLGSSLLFIFVALLAACAALCHNAALMVDSIVLAVLSVMLIGIAHSSQSITEVPMFLRQAVNQRQEVYMINLVGFNTVLATAIAPTMSQSILNRYGFSCLYFVLVGLCTLGIIIYLLISRKLRSDTNQSKKADKSKLAPLNKLSLFTNRFFMFLFFANMMWGMNNGTLLSFLIPFGKTVGINNMGLFFSIYSGVNICLRWVVPIFIQRVGRKRVLIASFICLALSTALLAGIKSSTTIILPAVLAGIGTSSIYTPIVSSVLEVMPPQFRMGGLGFFLISFEIGQGIASLIIGTCLQFMSYPQIFMIIAVFQLLGLACVVMGVPQDSRG